MASSSAAEVFLVHSELLYFLNGTIDNHSSSSIQSTIASFYRDDEILSAKQILVGVVEKFDNLDDLPIQSHLRKRIGENKVRTSLDDIFSIFSVVDNSGLCDKLPAFCAVTRSRVLLLTDEVSDIAAMRIELGQLRQITDNLAEQLSGFQSTTVPISAATASSACSHCSRFSASSDQDNNAASVNDVIMAAQATHVTHTDIVHNEVSALSPVVPSILASSSSDTTRNDFAAIVANNVDNLDNMQVVVKKKKKNKKVVVGANSNAVFKGVYKKAVVCVSRLELRTTADIVKSHLIGKNTDVLSCHDLANRESSHFTRVRLCVPHYKLNKVLNADTWPKGVTVRSWVFKPRESDDTVE